MYALNTLHLNITCLGKVTGLTAALQVPHDQVHHGVEFVGSHVHWRSLSVLWWRGVGDGPAALPALAVCWRLCQVQAERHVWLTRC